MRPGDAYWTLVQPIWNSVSFFGPDRFKQEYDDAPVTPRTLFAVHWCQSEVCNGGFYQFFYNSTGILAPEAATAFRSIAMPEIASVVEKAIGWFDVPYPRLRRERIAKLEADPGKKQFRPLDDEFYRLWNSENGGFLKAADTYAVQKHD